MSLNRNETLIVALLAYFAGRALTRRIPWLQRNSVPEAVTGGFLAAILFSTLTALGLELRFETAGRDTLLLAFFATVGLSARWQRLAEGGKTLLLIVALAVLMLPIQSMVGAGAVHLTGGRAVYGVLGGSVALSGGAGTVLAWAPTFEKLGLLQAEELGLAVAAMGMLLGAVIGGPLGRWLIRRHGLRPKGEAEVVLTSQEANASEPTISVDDFLGATLAGAASVGLGLLLHDLLLRVGLDIPAFATTLLAGAAITNLAPFLLPHAASPALSPAVRLWAKVSLNLFVAMAIMAVPLAVVFISLKEIVVLLALETLVLTLYVVFVVFRAMGSNYDAAVVSSGYFGLAMGATPIGVANMAAITQSVGPSPRAMLIVPLIGLAFFDVIHVFIVKWMILWLA